jgi:protein ImuB
MTLAHARALAGPGARIFPDDPARDRRALRRLAMWASRFSPIVGIDPVGGVGLAPAGPGRVILLDEDDGEPDGLVMDITGCAHLFAGELAMARAIRAGMRRLGFQSRIGIGPTIGAAWGVSRFAAEPIAIILDRSKKNGETHREVAGIGGVHEAIAPLPVRALRIGARTGAALNELGIERIGQLLDLPRASLPSRFGVELLLRLDQALGQAIELIEPVRASPPLRVGRAFDGAATQIEAIELTVRDLLGALSSELRRREAGVRELELVMDRVGRSVRPNHDAPSGREREGGQREGRGEGRVRERVRLSRPSRDGRHLWSLLHPRIERVHMGFGIESISLIAPRIEPLPHEQHEEWSDARPARYARMLDTLANHLGERRVLRAAPVESHIPECAFAWRGVVSERERRRDGETERRSGKAKRPERERGLEVGEETQRRRDEETKWKGAGRHEQVERPFILFDHPEPARAVALLPDHPPSRLRWRGRDLTIRIGIGPERIAEEWWRGRDGETKRRRDEARPGGTKVQRHKVDEAPTAKEVASPSSFPLPTASLRLFVSSSLSYRSYFRLQDDLGRWLWVFRDARGWFVHGIWS